jgi:hypothetical protein
MGITFEGITLDGITLSGIKFAGIIGWFGITLAPIYG